MIAFRLWTLVLAVLTFCSLMVGFAHGQEDEEKTPTTPRIDCTSAREFVTTLEFLRNHKEFGLDEPMSREVAHEVSKGCTGSAKRFVDAVEFLMTIELGTQDALTLAKELALKSDAHATTFIGVFKRSYASDKLDLDLHSSLLVARHLSIDYKGDVAIALEDYEAITSYCIDPDKIGLAKPQCAQLAGKIAKLGENFKKPMAPSFFAAMEFMRDELKVNVKEALDLSYRIVKVSPDAVENFKIAYLYGLKERGLALDAKSSLEFAIQIADRSVKKLSSDRVPASH